MAESENQMKRKALLKLIGRCFVSVFLAFLTQFCLCLVPHFFLPSSFLLLFSFSVLSLLAVAALGRCCKRLLRVRASAPAFVFFTVFFVWFVYIGVVRKAMSFLLDIVFNGELVMLIIGLYSILFSDPGLVANGSFSPDKLELEPLTCDRLQEDPAEKATVSAQRVRYCGHCKAHIKGFDHHCPAFGNCIGQKNHALFMILLVGFVISEITYMACSFQFITKSWILDKTGREITVSENLVISTMLFSLLQVVWQVFFLIWHIYCICFNIRTDEWINWKSYPEFQLVELPQPGQFITDRRFINPYDKGIKWNLKEFLTAKV